MTLKNDQQLILNGVLSYNLGLNLPEIAKKEDPTTTGETIKPKVEEQLP